MSAAVGAATATPYGRANILFWSVTGGLCGLVMSTLEIVLRATAGALPRSPVIVVFALRMVAYSAVLLGATAMAAALLRSLSLAVPLPGDVVLTPRTLLVTIGIALTFNLIFVLRALLGPGTLSALLVGRYIQPRREDRIVLFLDLIGSTQLAERLGDTVFHRLLNRVFFDLSDPVLETGGEIYRYVGDEMIVSWPLRRGADNAACVVCLFSMIDTLARRGADYLRRFGAQPRVRAALHAGPLIVGEMGDVKREIVLLGDTMNTAARIEEACRTTGRDFIASAPVLHALASLPPGVEAVDLGVMHLRGKAGSLELFALQRTATSSAAVATPPPNTSWTRTIQRPAASLTANGTDQAALPSRSTTFPE